MLLFFDRGLFLLFPFPRLIHYVLGLSYHYKTELFFLHVFRQAGPLRWVDCLAPTHYHIVSRTIVLQPFDYYTGNLPTELHRHYGLQLILGYWLPIWVSLQHKNIKTHYTKIMNLESEDNKQWKKTILQTYQNIYFDELVRNQRIQYNRDWKPNIRDEQKSFR